ncbi:ATP-binding cassette domain-containing protein, partial [Lactobacillus jensenii]|uniref:ATP-binding cassette domain-containing protein n=1 Tax=Lactobacillus jensenii TaxID=109790 RepID=UPI001F089515
MLRIENVNKNFGKKVILKDINLTVKPGERVHIVGKNGCGKSTLFKIITGILKAQGQVKLDEEDYLGAMIENPGFLEYETGLENLKFLAKLTHH